MKTFLLSILFITASACHLQAQNTDLPSPTANNQTLPSGSYVIAMDNTNQVNNAGYFNLKAYGLIVTLLNNAKKVKWVITAGKAKDGTDFTVNASPLIPVSTSYTKNITTTNGSTTATISNSTNIVVGMYVTSGTAGIQAGTTITAIVGTTITLSLPATANINNKSATFTLYSYPVSSYNFKAGPFVIFAADTTGVGSVITTFNNAISNANDKIKVYQTTASVTVDVRYDLTGFVPKAAILDDGGNVNIHTTYLTTCNVPSSNYQVAVGQDLLTDCYTFASEPHNDKTGSSVDASITAIKSFVQYGGNFLAQCHAAINYENNTNGRFQTTTGITDANSNAGTAISYPNPDLSFSQFEGDYSISIGGSLQNWRVNAAGANNFHKHSQANADATIMGTSVSKLKTGSGGLVFYIGNHNFDSYNSVTEVNGLRMYMNAFLTPVSIASSCTIGSDYMFPLALKLISFRGNVNNSTAYLSWDVNENEAIKQFEVERSSNGSAFTASAPINSKTISGNASYLYTESMRAELVYYRLKITDKNGVVRYSNILILRDNSNAGNDIKIISNPDEDKISLSFQSGADQPINISVLNMSGRQVMQQKINGNKGDNLTTLLLPSALSNGMYVVDLFDGIQHRSAKFVRN